MKFVDSSAWYALLIPGDPNHTDAVQVAQSNDQAFVTTDYIIGELLTLLIFRGESDRTGAIVSEIVDRGVAKIIWTTEGEFHVSLKTILQFKDKQWSFTDCVSRAVIQRFGIRTAFAFDDDFRQFGNVVVVPGKSD